MYQGHSTFAFGLTGPLLAYMFCGSYQLVGPLILLTAAPEETAMRVAVVSSWPLMRKAFCALLASRKHFNLALELDSALANAELVRKSHPDVLLIDAADPRFNLKDVSLLQKLIPDAKVVLLANEVNEEYETQAIRAGAWGCISRGSHPEVLEKALEVVAQGDLWVGHRIATRLIGRFARYREVEDERADSLTHREQEILGLVANGYRNKEIAARLSISENTVKTHLFTIFKKLRVSSRLGAALHYYHASEQGDGRLGAATGISPKPKRARHEPIESAAPPVDRRVA